MTVADSESRQGRLQRPADFTGKRLETFRAIFLRHGMPGALVGFLLILLVPGTLELFYSATQDAPQRPQVYGLGLVTILVGLGAYSLVRFRDLAPQQIGWILYLGVLSVWEEWVFRVAGPYYLQNAGLGLLAAVVVSNGVFGAMHYFTLRWKWQWCVGAFIGGMAFSRHFQMEHNLLAIIAIHWVATFLNTPRPPAGKLNGD